MKNIKYLLFTFVLMVFSISLVHANEIESIKVLAELDKEGNGHITEVWTVDLDSGTELYKPMGDLGNSEITNFKVSMDSINFNYDDDWDVSKSMKAKAYSNGINYTSDGIELCFGMTSYGEHVFTLDYDVSNMIYNLEDAQMLYWKFINDSMNPAPKSISVTIKGPYEYEDDLAVWGYGYEGYAYVDPTTHTIEMSNIETRNFRSSEYAVILVNYPLGTFDTDNTIEKYGNFEEVLEASQEGSFSYKKTNALSELFKGFISAVTGFGMLVLIILGIAGGKDKTYNTNPISYKNVDMYRDIPCDKSVINAYFVAKIYNFYRKKEDLFGAVLLKWILDGTVTVREDEEIGAFKTKKVISVDMSREYSDDTPVGKLYKMLKEAAGSNQILENKELEKWCRKNYDRLYDWFSDVEEYARQTYINKGYITAVEKGKVFKTTTYNVNPALETEATKLAGLKKFLKEISEIDTKQAIEVKLWEYYLIYAQIFGMADKVAKQFKKLYPEILSDMTNYNMDYNTIFLINSFSTNAVNAASQARASAESYSSGGGGMSFGGGGGGSFGGGSGGGAR